MKIEELFEAVAKPKTDQEKQDSKFMRAMSNELIRITKKSMKDGDVRWWMHSKDKLVIESDRSQRKTLTDSSAREYGFDGLEGVKSFFERHGLAPFKKPKEPKIVDKPIYD